jgi:TetR/AcrR family transcriptional regulator, tetracycline repressor protein
MGETAQKSRSRTARTRHTAGAKEASKQRERMLNRETVIAAALAEIDRSGLENFSLRNLAKALGVFPTAVSWYVPGRSHLLAEVARKVLEDITPPGFHDSWQGYLREFLRRFRQAIRRHPNVAPLIGSQLVANPAVDLEFIERLLAALAHGGLSGVRLVAAYNAVIAAAVGFTTQEFAPIPAENTAAWQKEIRDRLQSVSDTRYPQLARNMKLLGNKAFTLRWQNGTDAPLDASFEAFVDIVVLGLEQFAARD